MKINDLKKEGTLRLQFSFLIFFVAQISEGFLAVPKTDGQRRQVGHNAPNQWRLKKSDVRDPQLRCDESRVFFFVREISHVRLGCLRRRSERRHKKDPRKEDLNVLWSS